MLPLGEIVLMGGRVQTHHLCLERKDVLGHEWSSQVHLSDIVFRAEKLGLVNIAASQFGSNQELLTLTNWSDPVSILGLLGGIDSEVEAGLGA